MKKLIFLGLFSIVIISACTGSPTGQTIDKSYCKGSAICYSGTVTRVIDGDTIEVDGVVTRLALVNAPELNDVGGAEAKAFAETICPVGATALVDEDDGQIDGSYDRFVGLVYCNGENLNAELVINNYANIYREFCDVSEFAAEAWAKSYGC